MACTLTHSARVTFSKIPGRERQPSSQSERPRESRIWGIDQDQQLVVGFGNIDHDDLFVDIHLGGRQANSGAEYMVCAMSRARLRMPSSIAATGVAILCKRASG
jgi:hypothetical protein